MSSDILEGTLLGKALKLKLETKLRHELRDELQREAAVKAAAQTLTQVARHKLKRELTGLEHQTLCKYIDQLGAEAALDRILNATPDTLSAWLDVPA